MIWNRYLQIKQCLHVADNINLVESNKIAKIKPLYDTFNMRLKQFGILHDKLSIEKNDGTIQNLRLEIFFEKLSFDTRYGVYVVTTGTNIILIFIVKRSKDLEMSSV